MKTKTQGRRAKTVGVSLSPEQTVYAKSRTEKAGISFSRYVQLLMAYDRKHDVLGNALTMGLKAA